MLVTLERNFLKLNNVNHSNMKIIIHVYLTVSNDLCCSLEIQISSEQHKKSFGV